MTYFELVKTISDICLSHANVRSFYEGDTYEYDRVNDAANINYAVCVLTPDQHSISSNYIECSFELRYIDRQTDNRWNKLEVESTAIHTLHDIINTLSGYDGINIYGNDTTYDFAVDVFRDKYSDICAGAYINFTVTIDSLGECVYE